MVKTAGNTVAWDEHHLTVPSKGGYAIRAGNSFNLLGGELPIGQSFGIFLDLAQTPVSVADVTVPAATRQLYEYSIAPLNRPLDNVKFARSAGTGITDHFMSGTYTGTVQKIFQIKISTAGTPDTFAYRSSVDGGTSFVSWSSNIPITGAVQALAEGLTIKFRLTTGHTPNDQWEFFSPMPQKVEQPQRTTGSGLSDLTTSIQSSQNIVATHRQIFAIKIMTAATPDTYQYSTDGGVTYNGSNINCSASATELGATNIMVAFAATTGHTAGDIFKFHAFPATTYAQYAPQSNRILVGWAENRGESKPKVVLMSTGDLGKTENLDISSNVTISNEGIQYGGSDFTSDGENVSVGVTSYLKFLDAAGNALGGFSGKKIDVTANYAPWVTGAMGAANDDYAQYMYTVDGGTDFPLLDLNRGTINDVRSFSQSSHEQPDGMARIAYTPGSLDSSQTNVVVNDGTLFNVSPGDKSRIAIDLEEMLVTAVNSDTLTVTRNFNNTTAATHAAGSNGSKNVMYSWDNTGSTSGARQHVRHPPNNALTARTSSANGPAVSGWAFNSDVESNGLGPYAIVLERSQSASTGHPAQPWNSQWRQLGSSFQFIAVSGQTTISAVKDSGGVNNDELTIVGSGLTITTNNSTKTLTFTSSARSEVDVMTDGFAYG